MVQALNRAGVVDNIIRMKTFARKFREAKAALGKTDRDLAEMLGESLGRTSRMLNGKAEPTLANLVKLSDLTGLPIDYYARDEMESPSQTASLSRVDTLVLDLARLVGHDLALEAMSPLVKATGKLPHLVEPPRKSKRDGA